MSNKRSQSLGEIIKATFREKALNQSAIAKRMGVSKQVINQIDRRKHFDLEFLEALKAASGLDFTTYSFKQGEFVNEVNEGVMTYNTLVKESQLVEMALSVKLKTDPDQIGKIGELILTIRREAKKMGFTVL